MRVKRCAALALATAGLLGGCATTGPATPGDPFEGYNRAMFKFNDAVDNAVLKPVARGYNRAVPELVRRGVSNFFGNIGDVWSTANNLFQAKPEATATMTMRVAVNTFFGIGGLFDPATEMGLDRKSEDLGQTFGYWGAGPGPYVVLPFFGPSTVRDTIALPADRYVGATLLVDGTWPTTAVVTTETISTRASLLGASDMLDDIALDRYAFLRDAYLQRRRSLVYDGNPPEEEEERYDLPADAAAVPAPAASGN